MEFDSGKVFGANAPNGAPYGAWCIFADTYSDLECAVDLYVNKVKEGQAREYVNNTYIGILLGYHKRESAYEVKDLPGKVFDWCYQLTDVPLIQEHPFASWKELRQAFIDLVGAVDMCNWNPVIWIKDPETEQEFMIIAHGTDDLDRDYVTIAHPETVITGNYLRRVTLDVLAGCYTFLDGSPICKKVEL